MKKIKLPIFSIVLFVFAGIILIYSVWAAVYTIDIISTLVQQNQLVLSGNEFDLATFFMTNVGQYLIYSLILFSLGWVYLDKSSLRNQKSDPDDQPHISDESKKDDEDEAFGEMIDDIDELESNDTGSEEPGGTNLEEEA